MEKKRFELARDRAGSTPSRQDGRESGDVSRAPGSGVATAVPIAFSIFFFLLALVLHYLHSRQGFARITNYLYLYLLLGIFSGAAVALSNKSSLKNFLSTIGRYMILSAALGFGAPVLINYLFLNFTGASAFEVIGTWILVFFPPFVFYLIFDSSFGLGNSLRHLASFWIMGWLIVALLIIISSYTIPVRDSYEQLDVSGNVRDAWTVIKEGLLNVDDRARQAINGTTQRLDPNYYVGQVEQNEGRPLGVRLEEVEPIDAIFYPNESVTITGYIAAETFLDDSVHVDVVCSERRRDDVQALSSKTDYEVYFGHDELFECVFDDGFGPGRHTIDVEANFPFETWADITYDFITEEKSRTFARLGVDVYEELDIRKDPHAIYTNGPVVLGMGGSRMPILVSQEAPFLKNAVLGFTLESRWPRGQITHVDELELIIPEAFELLSCDRLADIGAAGPVQDENAPGYHKYVFTNVDPTNVYTSIRCEMDLASLDALADLVANDKVTRTFIARASYQYTLVSETNVRVAG